MTVVSFVQTTSFLVERQPWYVLQGPFRETKNPHHRVEFIQKTIDGWKRWYRDVFPSLVTTKKWKVQRRNVRVDDIVVVQDSNAVRGKWITGRIVNVFPGKNGRVRNVKVKTATTYYERPITKIAVLYTAEEYGDE